MLVNGSSHSYSVRPFSFPSDSSSSPPPLSLPMMLVKVIFQPVLVCPIFAMHVSGPRYPLPSIDAHFFCIFLLFSCV